MIPVKKKLTPTARRAADGRCPARRQRGTKEGTRARLIEAAIELMRKGGAEAVSTVSVTAAAGFAQPSFYIHFKNVVECLRAAAEEVAREVRAFTAEHRRQSFADGKNGAANPSAHFQVVLRLFVEQRKFAELLLRHRHDKSPLGRAMRKMMAGVRADLVEDSWGLAKSLGVREKHQERVALQAEFLLAQVMAAGEALLEGRFTDADMVAAELAAISKQPSKPPLRAAVRRNRRLSLGTSRQIQCASGPASQLTRASGPCNS